MAPGRPPLVGRDAACQAIVSALDGHPARSLVIAGPTGVGRTRLAREALALAEDRRRPTRWVNGTRTAAMVPFGAFAHLLPRVDSVGDPLALLQRATQAISGNGSAPRPVVGIDDVDLLDQLSITLVHQLAASGAATLVLTVRTGHEGHDPTAVLWKDGLASRIEIQPLERSETDRLVQLIVGGAVESRTAERLWRLARGNPLYLHELVDDGLRSGRLRAADHVWRWGGPMVPSPRLTELVLGQLGDLDADEWQVLQVLATSEPLEVDQVVALSSLGAVTSLVRRGLVVDDPGGLGAVRAAHPMHTEVVRSKVPEAGRHRIRQQLVDAMTPGDPAGNVLCGSRAVLDSGRWTRHAALLTDGARRAIALLDHPLAERLARAALHEGAGFPAQLALIEAVRWQGRAALADRLAADAVPTAGSDDDRARLAVVRALNLGCALGRPTEARSVLGETRVTVQDRAARACLDAAAAVLAVAVGAPEQAVQGACAVLAVPEAMAARPLAAAAAAAGLALSGRTGRALAEAEAGWSALESAPYPVERALSQVLLGHAEVLALAFRGPVDELERRTVELHRRALTPASGWPGDAIAALHRGWAAMAGGRLPTAIRWLTEARTGLEEGDPVGMLRLCRSLLATARALVGDVHGALELAVPSGGHDGGAVDPSVPMARALLAVAEGRTAQAGALIVDAAGRAAGHGQYPVEALLLHQALRLGEGRRVAPRLRELAEQLDSPMVVDVALQAEAVAAADGEQLHALSVRFEKTGALLLAADAAADAASAYERAGERRAAAVALARAAALVRECGLTQTPTVDLLSLPALTEREVEVARLASVGLSNHAIADRLVVSVRTVEAHLSHVYAKLGVGSRSDLATMLPQMAPKRYRNDRFSVVSLEARPGRAAPAW